MTDPCINDRWNRLTGMGLDFREISDLVSQRISLAKYTVSNCVGRGGVTEAWLEMKDKRWKPGTQWQCLGGDHRYGPSIST